MVQSHRIYRFKKPSDRLKLTDAYIAQVLPRAKEYFVKDTEVYGLSLIH